MKKKPLLPLITFILLTSINKAIAAPLSFDDFISSAPGQEIPAVAAQISATRVKQLPDRRDLLIEIKDKNAFEKQFDQWCQKMAPLPGEDYQYGAQIFEKDIFSATTYFHPGKVAINSCFGPDGKSLVGGYAFLKDRIIAFYAPTEAQEIRKSNVKLEAAEAKTREIESKKRAEESFRQAECKKNIKQAIQSTVSIGLKTNEGMVVEIKKPLVQVQRPGINGPILEWLDISALTPPYMGNYCSHPRSKN